MKIIAFALSRILLSVIYGVAILVRWVSKKLPRKNWKPNQCIMVIGTFHNPNWFLAHVSPLAAADVGNVILVTDEPVDHINNVIYSCPPTWLSRICSRAGAKLVWTFVSATKYRPDLFMAYHIFPATPIAVLAGALFNRPVCYQATSGSIEIEGGGWKADNRLLNSLKTSSAWIESLACKLIKPIDLIVVRGNEAYSYFDKKVEPKGAIVIQTGSVLTSDRRPTIDQRKIDLIFVGQLIERKRPQWLIAITAALTEQYPALRTMIVGDGEMLEQLKNETVNAGLEHNIEFAGKRSDVEALLLNAKVFVLTSRWEGVSIAMLEALASGTVPVVANVGDLSSAINPGKTGFLVEESQESFHAPVARLLGDPEYWNQVSESGYQWATKNVSREAVAGNWKKNLNAVITASTTLGNQVI